MIAQAQKGTKMHKHQGHCFVLFESSFKKYAARKAGQELELSPRQFEILRYLIRRRGEIIIRDQLLGEIWGYESTPVRALWTTISPDCGRRSNKTVESSAYRHRSRARLSLRRIEEFTDCADYAPQKLRTADCSEVLILSVQLFTISLQSVET